jgi:HK97 family phage prohead protease
VGYASVFNSKSQDLGGFVEIVRPGAFTRALTGGADVRALVNHDPNLILGRSAAGTLVLVEDERGLRVEILPPDTQAGRDTLESVRRGDLDGMSFAFRAIQDKWDYSDKARGTMLRELLDVDLFDVSVVAFPAYPKTDVALRSMAEARIRAEAESTHRQLETARRVVRLAEIEQGLGSIDTVR